ncbi:MAG: hypothetical protein AAF697_10920 [Pseudomonadota bacterium]
MTRTAIIALLAAPFALSACQNETEQAPDIVDTIETIPLEEAEDGEGGSADGTETPALPDTMESGSNPPEMTEPPAGSKVQPAD